MPEDFNPDSEIISKAEVFYLFGLLVTYLDEYRCVFDISDRVAEHIIHQPFRDNPIFFCDFVVKENGSAIEWNIDYAADNIRELSVPMDDVLKYIKAQNKHRLKVALDNQSDPFAKEKARNRRRDRKNMTPFLLDPMCNSLTKAIFKTEVLAPFVLKLTYKDGYKCLFDCAEFLSNASLPPTASKYPRDIFSA